MLSVFHIGINNNFKSIIFNNTTVYYQPLMSKLANLSSNLKTFIYTTLISLLV